MNKKVGLVLEGGGTRGIYTAGVLDTFLRNDVVFDGVVGVSAGALFGVNYVSKQEGRAIRYNKKYNHDKDYFGIKPLLKEGNIINTDYAYRKVPCELDPFDNEAFKQSNVSFYAVITDVETGKPEYVLVDDVFQQMDVLRASGSLPMVSRAVNLNGKLYLDGGVSDSIPYQWMHRQGYDKIVVVLTRDINYRKKPFSKKTAAVFLRKYPKIAISMLRRHKIYNKSVERLRELEQQGRVIVIRPSQEITISKLERDPVKLQEVYDMGVRDCKNKLESLKKYIGI